MKILFYILIFMFIESCKYPFFEPNNGSSPTVIITSFFCPDSVIRLKITPKTNAFSSLIDTLVINEIVLTNQKTGQIAFLKKKIGVESVYTTDKIIPKLGDVLKLEVISTDINEMVAIDSIANKVQPFRIIETTNTVRDFSGGTTVECYIDRNATIRFLPESRDEPIYLELLVFIDDYLRDINGNFIVKSGEYITNLTSSSSFITSEDYYPSITAIDAVHPQSLLFQCPITNDSIMVNLSYRNTMAASMGEMISMAHNLRIELRTVSYAYYQYKTALYKQKNAIRGDIIYGAAPPVMVPSNVENGTGIFAGYNVTSVDTFIDEYVYQLK